MRHWYVLAALLVPFACVHDADASNPNLYVSAENSVFENHFAGSMVVEVIIRDNNIRDTGQYRGEPDVTLNGKSLRMVQAADGGWYAYFANAQSAMAADSSVGLEGEGLDFGVFCGRNTAESVFGVSFSETDGFAVPGPGGLSNYTNGQEPLVACTGSPAGAANHNNVARNAKSMNTNPSVPSGQIGLEPDAWPLIQLFSFRDVVIKYRDYATQQVSLSYDEIPNVKVTQDREAYPAGSEVFLTIHDAQLNQDPTDRDSWTFGVDSSSVFYRAFDDNGYDGANGGPGLVNLAPHMSSLGFDDNGRLSIDTGSALELKTNSEQPATDISDGTGTFSGILTFVETGPNSGIFDTADHSSVSNIGVPADAPRNGAGTITYNRDSFTLLTGPSTASVSLGPGLSIGDGTQALTPGTEFRVVLTDDDQNTNSGARDRLDVSSDTAIIPTMRIGDPVTLEHASDVEFFALSDDPDSGVMAGSSVPDRNSARLFVDTSGVPDGGFEMVSMSLGVSAGTLGSSLVDPSLGTNWLNYDLRSLARDLEIFDFADASVELSFGAPGDSPIVIVDPGNLGSQGFVRLDDSDVEEISERTGTVFVTIDFDSSDDDEHVGRISDEDGLQPIVLDFFSFGVSDNDDVANSIYRFELEETGRNSSTFEGTLEYAVAGRTNLLDPGFVGRVQTISEDVRFVISGKLVDDDGITISYSDLNRVGTLATVSSKSNIPTHTGTVSFDSSSYRFGQSVKITVHDPDLNTNHAIREIYSVINDPASPHVDTVGRGGAVLLEVLIKDIRYQRCVVNGAEHGGLGATGFTLSETGTNTGTFEGTFKMPSQICDRSGSRLISPAGGGVDARYYDYQDSSGTSSTFSTARDSAPTPHAPPTLSTYEVVRPYSGTEEVILSGSLDDHRRATPLVLTITYPDGISEDFASELSSGGSYKSSISVSRNSPVGTYTLDLSHDGRSVGTVSFDVLEMGLEWLEDDAERWSSGLASDSDFAGAIRQMAQYGLIEAPRSAAPSDRIPDWVKQTARWWHEDVISDETFFGAIEYLLKKGTIRI